MSRKRKVKGECVYCGAFAELTRDHVIPKCLFLEPLPSNIITVAACRPCNAEKSKTDDYLRDFLVLDAYSSENKVAQTLFQEKMLSSVRRNSSTLAKAAILKAKPQPLFTPGGIYLGEILSFSVEGAEVFPRIVRGLYYRVLKGRIPDSYVFKVHRLDPFKFDETLTNVLQMNHFGPYRLGNGEFKCVFLCSSEDLFSGIWLLWFYDTIGICVITEPVSSLRSSAA